MVPGSDGPVDRVEAAREVAARVGYPVMIKAAAGGGGIGMMRVKDEPAPGPAFASAQRRAQSAFGSGALFVERYLEARPSRRGPGLRRRDAGACVHLHERECSIQRRHQKLVEESPAPGLAGGLEGAAHPRPPWPGRARSATSTRGRWSSSSEGDEFYFLEMNTRLQVEHPVTEEVTGLDLVAGAAARRRRRAAALDARSR